MADTVVLSLGHVRAVLTYSHSMLSLRFGTKKAAHGGCWTLLKLASTVLKELRSILKELGSLSAGAYRSSAVCLYGHRRRSAEVGLLVGRDLDYFVSGHRSAGSTVQVRCGDNGSYAAVLNPQLSRIEEFWRFGR